jgi:hypothetical protein
MEIIEPLPKRLSKNGVEEPRVVLSHLRDLFLCLPFHSVIFFTLELPLGSIPKPQVQRDIDGDAYC